MNKQTKQKWLKQEIEKCEQIHKCEKLILQIQIKNDCEEMVRCRKSDLKYLNNLLNECKTQKHLENVNSAINKHKAILEIAEKYKEME